MIIINEGDTEAIRNHFDSVKQMMPKKMYLKYVINNIFDNGYPLSKRASAFVDELEFLPKDKTVALLHSDIEHTNSVLEKYRIHMLLFYHLNEKESTSYFIDNAFNKEIAGFIFDRTICGLIKCSGEYDLAWDIEQLAKKNDIKKARELLQIWFNKYYEKLRYDKNKGWVFD